MKAQSWKQQNWKHNLETWLLTWKRYYQLGNIIIILETSLSAWKHHYQFGNIIINFETSLSTWRLYPHYGNKTFKSDISKLLVMFPNVFRCFEVDSVVSNLTVMFPRYKWCFQRGFPANNIGKLCFQVNYYRKIVSRKHNLETLVTWWRDYQLGNTTLNLVTSILVWKHRFVWKNQYDPYVSKL